MSNLDSGGRLDFASVPGLSGASVAFESIDGPPPAVFERLVAALNEEASVQHVTVVSRAGPATYRVRAYLSAVVERRKTSIAWVWDVYDAQRQRALRITGTEPAAARHRDAWSAADNHVLRNIARSGIAQMAAFLGVPPSRDTAPPPTAATRVATLTARR